jgi:CheY-like chemotaxis protein
LLRVRGSRLDGNGVGAHEGWCIVSTGWILLVNDIPDHRRSYEAAFRARGYQVRLTTSGAEALALLRQVRPVCAVIDVRLPDMTGWELCRQLKADKRLATMPVVILAPDVSRDSLQASRVSGCASWLMRPAAPDDVVHAVQQVLADGSGHPELDKALIGARHCPSCDGDDVRAGVRIGPVQYFLCKACHMRWRVDAQGEATA